MFQLSVRAGCVVLAMGTTVCALSSVACAWDYGLHLLPTEVDYPCMSHDGQVVADGTTLYAQTGITSVVRPSFPNLAIWSLNDDGTIFGGRYQGGGGGGLGLIDRGLGDYTTVGTSAQGSHPEVDALSGDGAIGLVNHQGRFWHNSYLLHADGSTEGINTPAGFGETYGNDLSRNGQVAVGRTDGTSGSMAYRYRSGVGYEVLTTPSGQNLQWATCVSADGSMIAGRVGEIGACLWTEDSFTDLAFDQSLYASCGVYEMNDDASVLVGYLVLAGPSPQQLTGAIWFEGQGWLRAQDYLLSLGISMPAGRTIEYLSEVSADGRTFLGEFDNGQHFVVTVPAASSLALVGLAALASRLRRR